MDGKGKTESAYDALDRGVRFAAEFTAARVKPSDHWTKAEAESFAEHSTLRRGSHRAVIAS